MSKEITPRIVYGIKSLESPKGFYDCTIGLYEAPAPILWTIFVVMSLIILVLPAPLKVVALLVLVALL